MESKRRKFTQEFKNSAITMIDTGRKVIDVAHDLGISPNILNRWRREKSEECSGKKAFTGNGISRDEELARLKKENAELREAKEILKKAMVIFTEKPGR